MAVKVKANFFIAGMPRSGTTSMYTYLKQHPEIYLSLYKEPNFFSRDLTQSDYNIQDGTVYHSLFAQAGEKPCIGEGSVWYLTSKIAAAEIKTYNPAAKIIIMLRNPLGMIYSLHGLYVRTGNEDIEDFHQALEAEAQRMEGERIPSGCYFPEGLYYTQVAMYYDKIRRFVDVFGQENVHVVIFDDFAADAARSYRDTLGFLGVNTGFAAEFNLSRAAARIRPLVLEQLRRALPEVKRKLSNKTGLRAHQGPSRTPLASALRGRLRDLFREDIDRTGRLIGRDLGCWLKERE
jgi:hypothetical protein